LEFLFIAQCLFFLEFLGWSLKTQKELYKYFSCKSACYGGNKKSFKNNSKKVLCKQKKYATFAAALGNRANENRETSSLIYCKDSVPPSWKRGGGTENEIEITGREKCLYGLIEVI